MKTYTSSLATKQMQIKIALRCHYAITKLPKRKQNLKTNIRKIRENKKVWGFCKLFYSFQRAICDKTHKTKDKNHIFFIFLIITIVCPADSTLSDVYQEMYKYFD